MNKIRKTVNAVLILALVVFANYGCKDKEIDEDAVKEKKWASEVYDAMSDIYLWNTALPSTFNDKKYATAQDALDYLSSLKINPATSKPIDKYSFLDKIGNLSGEIEGGTASGDYGFMVQAARSASDEISFYVIYVYKNSPAGIAGVERGCEITKINGSTDVHPTITTEGYLNTSSNGYKNMVNSLFSSTSASFTLKRPNGTSFDVSMNTASYAINSVLKDSIYSLSGNKAGYIVFNEFLGTTAQTELSDKISRFQANGVNNIIIDLRYNGGGSVETCEYLCNLLSPASANGSTMFRYKMNTLLTEYYAYKGWSTVSNFQKTNTYTPQKIYFIVSDNTASASELLINNLRPYFPGKIFLIGSTTYGKPCGFWPTPIGYTEDQTTEKEGYDLYAVSFEMQNANNEGSYYDGMKPGTTTYPGVEANDYVTIPWGDTRDACLSQALNHITTNAFKAQASNAPGVSKPKIMLQPTDRLFKGMIEFKKQLK